MKNTSLRGRGYFGLMRYLPKSPAERQEMLAAIGVKSIEELFASIPEKYRLRAPLNLPPAMSEAEVIDYFKARAAENSSGYASFLGAGVYNHLRSVVTDTILLRGEFLTSYTPYQAEISQGTLQAIFEFQTLMCQLTGQEVANASMYDGSTAATEAVLMAERVTGKHRVLVARSVHPEYRDVLKTYARSSGLSIEELGYAKNGQLDAGALKAALRDDVAAVVVQSPNFFGVIEEPGAIAEAAHAAGALLVVAIAEGVSLGILQPPVDADIVAMEAQSFGLPPSYGGPFAGVVASREKYVRQMPGRLAGQTTDSEGKRGFVLTLATREQHIRREKATSNICTNQALVALMANIFMSVYGKVGLKELAKQNLAKTAYAAQQFGKHATVLFSAAPRFNEFVVQTSEDPYAINSRLLGHKIVGGLPLKKFYPELGHASLWCCTELTTRSMIDTAAGVIAESERSQEAGQEEARIEEVAK